MESQAVQAVQAVGVVFDVVVVVVVGVGASWQSSWFSSVHTSGLGVVSGGLSHIQQAYNVFIQLFHCHRHVCLPVGHISLSVESNSQVNVWPVRSNVEFACFTSSQEAEA